MEGYRMEDMILNDFDAARMLVKILLEKSVINEQTATAVFERIKEMSSQKKAA
jgi:hypothetical protein